MTISPKLKQETMHLIRGFIAAIAVAVATATVHWLGAHISQLLTLVLLWAGGYGGSHAITKHFNV